MTVVVDTPKDAKDVIGQLTNPELGANVVPREINVSFRRQGSKVGSRDYATHLVHPYPAKMFHRIPSVFFDGVPLPQQCHVLDPFCGSGTVVLEASLRGFRCTGIDISPLARLISKVKVTPLDPDVLDGLLPEVLAKAKRFRSNPEPHEVLDSWLSPPARSSLHRLSRAVAEIEEPSIRAFFLVSLTSIARAVSLADPAIPPLVRLREDRAKVAGSRYRKALKHSLDLDTASVFESFADAAEANVRRMRSLYRGRSALGKVSIVSDADVHGARTGLASESVDAVVTSPPYCGAQKYVRSTKLELALIGVPSRQLRQLELSMLGTEAVTGRVPGIDELATDLEGLRDVIARIYAINPVRARMASEYARYVSDFAAECARVLRPGGHALVTLGRSTMGGETFFADRLFAEAGRAAGLDWVSTLIDPIPSRGLLTQRHHSAGRMDHEYIVWLRRGSDSTNCEGRGGT